MNNPHLSDDEERGSSDDESQEEIHQHELHRMLACGDLDDDNVFRQYVENTIEEAIEIFEWNEDWNEEPFHDGDEDAREDIEVNDMWDGMTCCTQIAMKHFRADEPLFAGSPHKAKDIARFLMALKCRHMKMGDSAMSAIIGMLASFLPSGMFVYMFILCYYIFDLINILIF
jgi:hypothetical protein